MELKLEELTKIQQEAGKLIEAGGLLENNFIKTQEDFIQVKEVVSSWMDQWKENLKLDAQHEIMKGQLADLIQDFELEQQFLESRFSEREEVIRKNLEVVDFAIESSDDELILEALFNASQVVCENPLKEVKRLKTKNNVSRFGSSIRFA